MRSPSGVAESTLLPVGRTASLAELSDVERADYTGIANDSGRSSRRAIARGPPWRQATQMATHVCELREWRTG